MNIYIEVIIIKKLVVLNMYNIIIRLNNDNIDI